MADNAVANPGVGGDTFAADEIGGIKYPRTKIVWGVDGVATEVTASDPFPVVQTGALPAGSANIGDVDVLTVPSDPFGVNADAASATGSISAKLRFIASTGIPITGTVAIGSIAAGDNNIGNVDVVTLPALPAGTNNIGDVDVLTLPALVAGSANIGDVDVLTVPTDPFGANADAASATGSISAKLRFIAATGIPITGTVAIGSIAAGNNNIGDVDVASIAAGDNNIGNVDIVTLPAKKITYAASAAQTQTNLDGLASSSTHVAGWEGTAIDNSSNLYLDYIINAKIQVESAGLTAGEIRLYLVAELEDSTWPDVFDGTESTETVTSVGIRDAICRLAAVVATTTDASRVYYLNCPSVAYVFNGVVPRKFVPFITQSTVAALETTGDPNQVYVKGVYLT